MRVWSKSPVTRTQLAGVYRRWCSSRGGQSMACAAGGKWANAASRQRRAELPRLIASRPCEVGELVDSENDLLRTSYL